MNFISQHLLQIIADYNGELPLSIFLKSYFKQHPKLGSRDRKAITEGVYIYYRSVLFLDTNASPLTIIQQGYFLCKSDNSFLARQIGVDSNKPPIIDAYAPEIGTPLSPGLDEDVWLKSIWKQPRVFIRIIQNHGLAMELLEQNNISYQIETFPAEYGANYTCISVPNSAPIDKILFSEDYIIQDRSSQIALLIAAKYTQQAPDYIWDVCSGAGGKTLLLHQLYPNATVLASDNRKSILHNLKGRCANYGYKTVKTLQLDATLPEEIAKQLGKKQYDVVVADVPCTGSGTWSRTPEQFFFFNAAYFDQFAHLQYPIAANTLPYLKKGGLLVYITCSVMQHENEAVTNKLLSQQPNMRLLHQELILGMEHLADTLYVAVFKKI